MRMDAERWQRIEQVCQGALEHDESQQASFVQAACAGDDDLRREVESLLAYQKKADRFIETPALEAAARALAADQSSRASDASRLVGRLISHYRIVEKVASGGMGDVYRAVRADGAYQMQVAIKFIPGAHSTDFFLARFQNERQILASLDHPNIARLIDGGTSGDGLPYVVMEYIEGLPMDAYCAQEGLTILERLALFRTVCSAVQYAHQNLVVHRDLKPSNILVTREGVPKLLDFGIAKILHPQPGEDESKQTVTLFQMLTPDYASPEQVRNEAITTRSDVYSLGVILYELLTEVRPYRLSTSSAHEIVKAICDTEPEKPSIAGERPEKRRKALAGDLDNIILKALRKEPERRYSSVEQFSEDIRRHLVGLPVLAHKDTLPYRARKFIGRHKVGVAAAALLILSLAGGLITTLWQARIAKFERARAERRFNDVRVLANSLMFDVHDAIKDLPGATAARKLLVGNALRYLDSLAQEASGDLSLQRELASAYEKVGDVQGAPFSANLGDTAGALASYRKALAIRESIVGSEGNSVDAQKSLAIDDEKVGQSLVASGDYRGGLQYIQKVFTIQQRLATVIPGPESQERLAGSYYEMALCQSDLGDFKTALASLQESVAIREAISDAPPPLHARIQTRLAGTYGRLALVVAHEGDPKRAVAMCAKSADIMQKLSKADPTNAMYREYLNESILYTGFYQQESGDLSPALKNFRVALAGFVALSRADPNEARAQRFIGVCEKHIGYVQAARGNIAQGMEHMRKGLALAQELYRKDPAEKSDKLTDLADAYAALGFGYVHAASQPGISDAARVANWKEARASYQRSLDTWLDARRQGVISRLDSDIPDMVTRELARCEAALANLHASIH
jgi:tetratricopeptide (TPR) repeat protein/tRNA A-37 threonylcarbamoyl transferase component Bud32